MSRRVALHNQPETTHDGIPYQVWKQVQDQVIHSLFVGRGIHEDERQSYDQFIPLMLDMIRRQLKPQYDHQAGRRRYIVRFHNLRVNRPWHPEHGPITPTDGILLGMYDALVYADVGYEVYAPEGTDMHVSPPPLLPPLIIDPLDTPDDEVSDLLTELEQELTLEKPSKKLKTEAQAADDSMEEAGLPGFQVNRTDRDPYPQLVHQSPVTKNIMVCRIPAYVLSGMCQMSTPFAHPVSFFTPSNVGGTFAVSHIHKICPGIEMVPCNTISDDRKGFVQARLSFIEPDKRGRTNSTLNFSLVEPALTNKKRKDEPEPVDDEKKSKGPSVKRMTLTDIPRFLIEIPHENPKVYAPIAVLCMAYGWTMAEILSAVKMYINQPITPAMQWYLEAVAHRTEGCATQEQAIQRIGRCFFKCRKEGCSPSVTASFVSYTLMSEFFPNLNTGVPAYDNVRKGFELCRIIATLILQTDLVNHGLTETARWRPRDIRSYVDKRIQMPGEQLMIFFRLAVKDGSCKIAVKIRQAVLDGRPIDNVHAYFDPSMIKISQGIRNGVFDVKNMNDATQTNQHRTQAAVTGFGTKGMHMQVSTIRKPGTRPVDAERLLTHPTQIGRVDPYVTPESENCGITRYKCPECLITGYVSLSDVMSILRTIIDRCSDECGWVPVGTDRRLPGASSHVLVYDVMGGLCGWVRDYRRLYHHLVTARRQGLYPAHVTFSYDPQRQLFWIHADAGRMLRPLLVRQKLPELVQRASILTRLRDPMTWLLNQGFVEYVCAAEEFRSQSADHTDVLMLAAPSLDVAAQSPLYTHIAIHPGNMLALTAGGPYANMQQGPRMMHAANNGKRAIPFQWFPWDNGTHEAYQLGSLPDKSLVSSLYDTSRMFPSMEEPNEQHVTVAFLMTHSNIEDGVTVRQGLIDGGFGASIELSIVVCKASPEVVFRKPASDVRGISSIDKYDGLLPTGIPRIGASLRGKDAVVGRVLQYKDSVTGEMRLRDASHYMPDSAYTYRVAHVEWMENKAGSVVQVYVQKVNRPGKGDKFYFPYGQKFTINGILPDADFPFIAYGPLAGTPIDMLVNPLALSRGTMGMGVDMMSRTARLINPDCLDPCDTLFLSKQELDHDLRLVQSIMVQNGFTARGRTRLINGETGCDMGQVVVGTLPSRVLKHMAQNKVRARARGGQVDQLTRQAIPGKKEDGGLRRGEMERTNEGPSTGMSAVSHAGSSMTTYWCLRCRIQAIGSVDTDQAVCQGCGTFDQVCKMVSSYTGVLVMNELAAAGIGILPVVRPTFEPVLDV
jgi:DNA-directed RNA polymerase beta subunit